MGGLTRYKKKQFQGSVSMLLHGTEQKKMYFAIMMQNFVWRHTKSCNVPCNSAIASGNGGGRVGPGEAEAGAPAAQALRRVRPPGAPGEVPRQGLKLEHLRARCIPNIRASMRRHSTN